MKIALIKNNKVENIIVCESLELAESLFVSEGFEIINADVAISQDYDGQLLSIGCERNQDGSWFDPNYRPWTGPPSID